MVTTHLTITTPDKIFFEGDVEIVTLKVNQGYKGFLANMNPFFSNIEVGHLIIGYEKDESSIKCYIGSGLIYSDKTSINIITDDILKVDEIDLARAEREKTLFEQQLKSHESRINEIKWELKLKKAISRIQTYNEYYK